MKEFVPKGKGPVVIKGASNSNTIAKDYIDSVQIAYRFIGSKEADTSFEFCGRKLPAPIMAGPIGGQNKIMEQGALHYARAVSEAETVSWIGYHDADTWEKVMEEKLPAIRVIKPLGDLELLKEEIRRDEERGALAFSMDIDHGITLYGKNDFQKIAFGPKTIEELHELAECTKLPFYVKGIMSVEDAIAAKKAGVAGIILSGHNNRFPCAVAPLRILPEVRKAVGEDFTVFIDGGFDNGYDIFKALALGADGVLCARAFLSSFARDGEEGLTDFILELQAQLKGAMSNTGSYDLKHINRDAVILP